MIAIIDYDAYYNKKSTVKMRKCTVRSDMMF